MDPLVPAPPVGWHGREVLGEVGFGDTFSELVEKGAIAVPKENPVTA